MSEGRTRWEPEAYCPHCRGTARLMSSVEVSVAISAGTQGCPGRALPPAPLSLALVPACLRLRGHVRIFWECRARSGSAAPRLWLACPGPDGRPAALTPAASVRY